MSGVLRFDSGSLGNVQRTPQGGIRVPARLTRAGIFVYLNPDGSKRREYRSKEEVSRADSLATLTDAPVTHLHPRELVTPANFAAVVRGTVSGTARVDGSQIEADLAIQDARLIERIERGDREVSCGYRCKLIHTPGISPEGERYDAIQTEIRYNHVAVVPRGRAGREIALRLDAEDNQIREDASAMKVEIINGVEYEVGTPAHTSAAVARQDAADNAAGRLAALEAENKDLRTRLDAAPKALAEAVRARVALEGAAGRAKVEVRADMSDDDLRRAVISKVLPDLDLKDKDAGYLAGAFDVALGKIGPASSSSAESVRADAVAARRGDVREDAADPRPPDVIAREKMIKGLTPGKRDA